MYHARGYKNCLQHAVLITPCTTYVLWQDGDFLLFVLRELLLGGHAPQLRVILMSATYAHPRLEPSSSLGDLPTLFPSATLLTRQGLPAHSALSTTLLTRQGPPAHSALYYSTHEAGPTCPLCPIYYFTRARGWARLPTLLPSRASA